MNTSTSTWHSCAENLEMARLIITSIDVNCSAAAGANGLQTSQTRCAGHMRDYATGTSNVGKCDVAIAHSMAASLIASRRRNSGECSGADE